MLEYITPFRLKLIRKQLTQEQIDFYNEYERRYGDCTTFDATCNNCDKLLKPGDWVDGQWPYETEHNGCLECESDE